MRIYVRYHAPLALETTACAGYHLGLDCPDGWKKAARQQARLPLVLCVPAISPRISPTTVNIHVYAAYRTSSNFSNMSIMCKSREFNEMRGRFPLLPFYRRFHYALLLNIAIWSNYHNLTHCDGANLTICCWWAEDEPSELVMIAQNSENSNQTSL